MFGSTWDEIRFPMTAEIYYVQNSQGGFGQIEKRWIFDRTIKCSAISYMADRTLIGENKPNGAFTQIKSDVYLRTKQDIRESSVGQYFQIPSILITNIKDPNGNMPFLFKKDDSMKFEIQTIVPSYDVNHNIDYYRTYISRSDIQIEDLVK